MLINEAQPVGEVEAMMLGYVFGKASEKAKKLAEHMSAAIDARK